MSTEDDVRVMLGRRPSRVGMPAFGHVDVNQAARKSIFRFVKELTERTQSLTALEFHPYDEAESGEVLEAKLANFDQYFQPLAPWSLERAVKQIKAPKLPSTLGASEISDGEWTFYVIRAALSPTPAIVIRNRSPTRGLGSHGKVMTLFRGGELVPVKEPLVAFDLSADALVVGTKVYVTNPQTIEYLFVDAEAVRKRAPETARSFTGVLGTPLSNATNTAIERVCSRDANYGRRVEHLLRDVNLEKVAAPEVRQSLPDARLPLGTFGLRGPLRADTDIHAKALIDIVADRYYQPRFEDDPRRVGTYRRLRT